MLRTTTPLVSLERIDAAGETLRAMRHTAERDDRFRDLELGADLTAAIAALMRFRLAVQREHEGRPA
jgi:hypothetical protein